MLQKTQVTNFTMFLCIFNKRTLTLSNHHLLFQQYPLLLPKR